MAPTTSTRAAPGIDDSALQHSTPAAALATWPAGVPLSTADALALLSDGPIEVVSDSTYVVNCFRDGWWEAWLRNGWRNTRRQPVANRDLWEALVELVRERGDVTFRWVKGHGEDQFNALVDALAVAAIPR